MPLFREPISTWTHLIWALMAGPATMLLLWRCRHDWAKQISVLIFGLTLICCFGGSACYHGARLPDHELLYFVTLDYIGIYLLIAGSCTPIVFNMLEGRWRWGLLAAIWSLAILGIGSRLIFTEVPKALTTGLYLGMGWGLLVSYPLLARVKSHRDLILLPMGGLFYSVGASFDLAHWPVVWPGVFGSHELMHIFVMVGSLLHYWFIYEFVPPFERKPWRPAAPAPAPEPAIMEPAILETVQN